MDIYVVSFVLLAALGIAILSGLWIGFSLILVGFIAIVLTAPVDPSIVYATRLWGGMSVWDFTALPMFIWMGEILVKSGISKNLFTGLAPLTRYLPGRLLHVNVFGCALFSSVCGSSAATTATIGRIAVPELAQRNYDERMVLGTLAGSGTFGFLVPPSIILIIYGSTTGASISQLFLAGIIPAVLLATMFSTYIVVWAFFNRKKMSLVRHGDGDNGALRDIVTLLPLIGLFVVVIGSIYAGLASPTESAVLGVVGALALAWSQGSLSLESFWEGARSATLMTCMISFILAGATFVTVGMGFSGIPRALASWIDGLELSQGLLIFSLFLFFIILGLFLDGISIIVLTASIIIPTVTTAGIDLIWFGIFLVILVEISQITPPIGFNLFVLQGITGKEIGEISLAALPFFLLMLLSIIIIYVFPEIVLVVPEWYRK